MSLILTDVPSPTLLWQFESSNVDSITGLSPLASNNSTISYNSSGKYNSSIVINTNNAAGAPASYLKYSLAALPSITVTCWIKPFSVSSTNQVVWGISDSTGTVANWLQFIVNSSTIAVYGQNPSTSAPLQTMQMGNTPVQNGVWYHTALTMSSSGAVYVYFNGVEFGPLQQYSAGTPNGVFRQLWSTWTASSLVVSSNTRFPGTNSGMWCEYDDLRVFNSVLSAAQIQNIYNQNANLSRVSDIYKSPGYTTPLQLWNAPPYSFTSFAFTSSNVVGSTGPTLSQFTNIRYYSSLALNPVVPQTAYYSPVKDQSWYYKYWSLYSSQAGYQKWAVPKTATYAVIAAGAPGGCTTNSALVGSAYGPGGAAILAGPFQFKQSQNLIICIGQSGDSFTSTAAVVQYANPGRGGGGMTCIVDAANTSIPLLVAAGGGGANSRSSAVSMYAGRAIHFVTSSDIPSAAGRDASGATSNNAGAGWSQSITTGAKSFADGLTGGLNTAQSGTNSGTNNAGGFGGGGSGGLIAATSEIGGGGGGWIGGGAGGSTPGDYSSYSSGTYYTYAANTGGNGGWSYCLPSTSPSAAVSPIFFVNGQFTDNNDVQNGMVWIAPVTPLYSNFTINFTTCGAAQNNPPTWAQVSSNTYYLSNTAQINYLVPFFFAFRNGYQAWIVPYTGNYLITAVGGSGSSGYLGVSNSSNATSVSQTFALTIGDILIITVGQGGTAPGGGGGMSTVHRNGCTSNVNPTPDCSTTNPGYPLLCAGGGAGGAGGAGVNGIDNFVTYTGTQQSTTLPFSGTNTGSGIYSQGGRANSWMGENIPNTGFNPRITSTGTTGLANGLTGGGAWGGAGRPGANAATQIPGSGGGFFAGSGGANSSSSAASGGFSYCQTAGFSNVSASNAVIGSGGVSVRGNDGFVKIQQL